MKEVNLLQKIRPDVRGRTAAGLIRAGVLFSDYNYTNKFRKSTKGSVGAGHRFERKVVTTLEERYGTFTSSLAFRFQTEYALRSICIVDGIYFHPDGSIIICEVKLRHTIDSWYQLRHLYEPVVRRAFPGKKIRLLEICKYFAPEEKFPESFVVPTSFKEFANVGPGGPELGVLIWPHR